MSQEKPEQPNGAQSGKSREEKLREAHWRIEKILLSEDKAMQCDVCTDKEHNFQFHNEGWMIESEFFCNKHKERGIELLEEIAEEGKKRRLYRERIVLGRRDLTDDEDAMETLLAERRSKTRRSVQSGEREAIAWWEAHPDASYGDVIRALFEAEEKAERKE